MSEKQLQQGLVDAAGHCGWLVYHTHDSRRSEPGFPDLVLVHRDRLRIAFIECKSERGRMTTDQVKWIVALEDVAAEFMDAVAATASDRLPQFRVGIANPDTYDSWLAFIMGSRA